MGLAAPHLLYDPYRVNYPLKRTNPKKGLGEDPTFVRISWEEALDTIDQKLKECQSRDSRGLFYNRPPKTGHQKQLQMASPKSPR
jgi:anaerobic selenocysteine-containing dehydrogenase